MSNITGTITDFWLAFFVLITASEMQIQNFYAALDQRLHTGKFPLEKPTIEIMEEVHTKFYGIPYVHNTVWVYKYSYL